MLSKEEFVRRVLDGAPGESRSTVQATSMIKGFEDFRAEVCAVAAADARFAQSLLESGFGAGRRLPRTQIVLGDPGAHRFLSAGVTHWQKMPERPFDIVLFELANTGRELLEEEFFSKSDSLEHALLALVQDALEGFERGSLEHTADGRPSSPTETLCVICIVDDRRSDRRRHLVCFGTRCIATQALEVFTLREEVRDWARNGDRPLAEEHLGQLFERHFAPLSRGARWQEAFISDRERKKTAALMAACRQSGLAGKVEQALRRTTHDLLEELAGSFGIERRRDRESHRLEMVELPGNHGIAVDPDVWHQPGFKNPLLGVCARDSSERLLGFVVYTAGAKADAEHLRERLRAHHHFHNILVIYADSEAPELELWQGAQPLRGRLVCGNRPSRFDGEGGIVQLLCRFFVVGRSTIDKPAQLAKELAWRARHLKAIALKELEREAARGGGPLRNLFNRFKQVLATLDEPQFADAYSQTVTYGMLAARWISTERHGALFSRRTIPELLPSTSGFLKDLLQNLINSNFDQNLAWLLDDIASLLARTSVTEVFRGEKDPAIHFYQDFLDAYDPQIRRDQGVYYTPDEVVSYIVRTVHQSLQTDFGLPLGLADTTTWAEFAAARKVPVPEGVDPEAAFVQVLDPALGTGTFLLRVIEVIHATMRAEYTRRGLDIEAATREWIAYVRRDLLPRLHGFEHMMAPYVVSHLRLGLALQETGFVFDQEDRLGVFLTNTLEMDTPSRFSLMGEYVSEEAKQAERVKKSVGMSVVLGNPPYAGHSSNNGEWARGLVEPYGSIDGERLRLAQGKWLQNDYVKFMAYGERRVAATGCGIMAYVTDHSYLDGDTFSGMRHHLLSTFSSVDVVNLHGNLTRREVPPGGGRDENVFDIHQGVAIFRGTLAPNGAPAGLGRFRVADVWGSRDDKLRMLQLAVQQRVAIDWATLPYFDSRYLFVNGGSSSAVDAEFARFDAIDAVFSVNGRAAPGFLTTHDDFAIGFTRREMEDKVEQLVGTQTEKEARERFKLCGQSQWQYADAKRALASGAWRSKVTRCLYRPFDERWTVYDSNVLVHRRERVNAHLVEPGNVALLVSRMTKGDDFGHVFVSDKITEVICLSSKTAANAFVFPLYLRGADGVAGCDRPNIDSGIWAGYAEIVGKEALTPLAVFEYVYAVLHSPAYRRRYNELLIREFPRVPRPGSVALFRELSGRGRRLMELHLLGHQGGGDPAGAFLWGSGDNRVAAGMPRYEAARERVWINGGQYFAGIEPRVWGFKVGSYEVCRKWLSGRRGRRLGDEECGRFGGIVGAVRGSVEEMEGIDRVVEGYGGWAGAFWGEGRVSVRVGAKVGG